MPAPRLLWLGGLALGAAVRGLYLLTPALDSDMAIVGLMARHILQGEFPIFFWGQPFAGTIESLLAAVLFFLFGPSRLTLALSPFLFSLAFLVLTYRLAREAFDRQVGLLALYLAAIPAPFLITHSVTARSNYIENLVLGNLVLLLTLRVSREPGPGRRRFLFLLGLVAGLAWYESPQSIHYLLTGGLVLLLRAPRLLVRAESWSVPPAFLLGSLPFWLYNLRSPAESTFAAIHNQAGGQELARSLARYLAEKIPYVLGAVERGTGVQLSLALLVLVLYAAAFLHLLRRWKAPGSQLVLLFVLITSTVIVLGYNQGGSTRYLLPLYSVLPIMVAAFLASLRRLSVPLFATALVGLLASNLAATAARAEVLDAAKRQLYRSDLARDSGLIDFLQADGLTRVYVSDFWDAYRLTFDAQERVVFAEPSPSFYPPYTAWVDTAARYGYVVKGRQTVQDFKDTLQGVGGTYRKRRVSGYTIFDDLTPPAGPPLRALSREAWQGSASHAAADAAKAFDRDPFTSWRTGPLEAAEAYYQLDLGRLRTIAQVSLLPARAEEAPRAFRIQGSKDGERWETALAFPGAWRGLAWVESRLRMEDTGRIQARVRPVEARWLRITLLRGAGLEWSIRELFVSEVSPETTPPARPGALQAFRRGLERKDARDWPGAVRAFQEAVDEDPDWAEPHVQLVAASQQLGINREEPYERALGLERWGVAEPAARAFWKAAQVFPHSHHTDPLLRLLRLGGAAGVPERGEPITRRLAAFVPAEPVEASFGGRIRLLGYTVDRREVEPGGGVRLSYFWECLEEVSKDYVVFAHARRDGVEFGDDHAPLDGLYPTSRWRKGEVVREDRLLRIPDHLGPGPLVLVVGLWDPPSGKRLRVTGAAAKEDGVRLTRLLVAERAPRSR